MGKVYIGVTAVYRYKLWGGRQEGCGIRWFGGMGGRWKIDDRRREGCGPGMPGPYGVVEGCAGAGREWAVGEVTGHCCVCFRIRSKISLRILCKSRILLL